MKQNDIGQGYVHVYTGNGKGKTTAALGLALRAAGVGLKIFIAQFVKGLDCSELDSLALFSGSINVRRFGRNRFIIGEPEPDDISAAREGLAVVRKVIKNAEYDVVILDEANIAVYFKLFSVNKLLEIIDQKPE